VGAGEAELLAQGVGEQHPRLDGDLALDAVHGQLHDVGHAASSLTLVSRVPGAVLDAELASSLTLPSPPSCLLRPRATPAGRRRPTSTPAVRRL
jgi:hypothetical protein